MLKKALFLDRDGVINREKDYVIKIEDFEFADGVFEALKRFQEKGYLIIIITNQSGIGRGYYSEEDFNHLNDWMLCEFEKKGIHISKVYYSPYHPVYGVGIYKKDSYCRKPNPGMIFKAVEEFGVDLERSVLVGDNESDIIAGMNAGIRKNVLVKNGRDVQIGSIPLSQVIESIKDLEVDENDG